MVAPPPALRVSSWRHSRLGRSRWFNTTHQRTGTLWEGRFKSVLVEEGVASRTMAAYIDSR